MSNALYPDAIHGLTFTVLKTPEFSTLIETVPSASELRLPQTRNPIWHFTLVYDYLYGNMRSPNNTRPYAPYSDQSYLQGFYLARRGKLDDFLLNDPKDNTAAGMLLGPWQAAANYGFNALIIDPAGHAQLSLLGGISGNLVPVWNDSAGTTSDGTIIWADQGYWPYGFPNAPCVLQLLADGVGNYYSPVQRVLGGVVYEDITDLNGAITVWADGVLQVVSTDYTLLGPGLWLNDVLYAGMYLKWAAQPTGPVAARFAFYFRVRFEMDSQDFERTMDELYTIGGSLSKSGSGMLKLITARPNAPAAALPPIPPPPPARSVVSGTVGVWTSYTNTTGGAEDCLAGVNAGDGFPTWNPGWGQFDVHAIVKTDVPYGLRKDTFVLATADIHQVNTTGDFPISMFIYSGTPNPSVSGVFMQWYDCYIDVTYSDGSTARVRPTRSFVDVQNGVPGFGFVTNPNNAFDADSDPPVTFATWTRSSMDALNFVNSFILSGLNF